MGFVFCWGEGVQGNTHAKSVTLLNDLSIHPAIHLYPESLAMGQTMHKLSILLWINTEQTELFTLKAMKIYRAPAVLTCARGP